MEANGVDMTALVSGPDLNTGTFTINVLDDIVDRPEPPAEE